MTAGRRIATFGFAVLAAALLAAAAPSALAQDSDATLAQIRSELSALSAEIASLRAELAGGGTAAPSAAQGGNALERVEAVETALRRLTARTEELEFRIRRITEDAANRLGDLEFRLTELEGGDPTALAPQPPLGGEAGAGTPEPGNGGEQVPTGELAVGERADFEAARAAYDAADWRVAADRFEAFAIAYPGSPLQGEADYLRGAALSELGETTAAARAFLRSFSDAPDGPRAPDALFRLGAALGALEQTAEACVTLAEVGVRYPDSTAVAEAERTRAALGCR